MSEAQKQRLREIRQRKEALEAKFNREDATAVTKIMNVMQDQKIQLFDHANNYTADSIQKLFDIKTKEDVDDMIKRTDRV